MLTLSIKKQGRLHNQRRLHHLAPLRREGPLHRDLRQLSRLEVLPRAGQVCRADAGGRTGAQPDAEMGLGSRKAGSGTQSGLASDGDE